MSTRNVYGIPGLEYVFKNTWKIFKVVLPSTIIPYLILNVIQLNSKELEYALSTNILITASIFIMIIILQNYLILTADAIIRAKNIVVTKRLTIALKKTFPIILLLFGLSVLFSSVVMLCALLGAGQVLAIMPGLYLIIKLLLVWPVLLLENKGLFVSVGRSYTMTKHSLWFIVVATIILQLAILIPLLIRPLLAAVFARYYTDSNMLLAILVGVITAPLQILGSCNVLVVYYVILRRENTRNEPVKVN